MTFQLCCRYLNLQRLEAAIPRVLKPSEISQQQERAAMKMRRLQRIQEEATANVAMCGGGNSLKKTAELASVRQQLAALQEEQEKLKSLAATFSEADMKRTPLPRSLTPAVMSIKYSCEFGTPMKASDLKDAGEHVRQNAIEVFTSIIISTTITFVIVK